MGYVILTIISLVVGFVLGRSSDGNNAISHATNYVDTEIQYVHDRIDSEVEDLKALIAKKV